MKPFDWRLYSQQLYQATPGEDHNVLYAGLQAMADADPFAAQAPTVDQVKQVGLRTLAAQQEAQKQSLLAQSTSPMDYVRGIAKGYTSGIGESGGFGLEKIGEALGSDTLIGAGRNMQDYWGQKTKALEAGQSEPYRAKMAEPFIKDNPDSLLGFSLNPSGWSPAKLGGMLAETAVPTGVGMALGAGLGQKVGSLIAGSAKVGTPAYKAGTIMAAMTGSGAEGFQAGLEQARGVHAQVMGAPESQISQTPEYQEVYNHPSLADLPEDQRRLAARKEIANQAALKVGGLVGIGEALVSGPSSMILQKALLGKEYKKLLPVIGKEVLSEGLLEEAPQSAMEQLGTNWTEQRYINPEKKIWAPDVLEQAIGGGITGGIMGGAMGGGGHLIGQHAQTRDLLKANNYSKFIADNAHKLTDEQLVQHRDLTQQTAEAMAESGLKPVVAAIPETEQSIGKFNAEIARREGLAKTHAEFVDSLQKEITEGRMTETDLKPLVDEGHLKVEDIGELGRRLGQPIDMMTDSGAADSIIEQAARGDIQGAGEKAAALTSRLRSGATLYGVEETSGLTPIEALRVPLTEPGPTEGDLLAGKVHGINIKTDIGRQESDRQGKGRMVGEVGGREQTPRGAVPKPVPGEGATQAGGVLQEAGPAGRPAGGGQELAPSGEPQPAAVNPQVQAVQGIYQELVDSPEHRPPEWFSGLDVWARHGGPHILARTLFKASQGEPLNKVEAKALEGLSPEIERRIVQATRPETIAMTESPAGLPRMPQEARSQSGEGVDQGQISPESGFRIPTPDSGLQTPDSLQGWPVGSAPPGAQPNEALGATTTEAGAPARPAPALITGQEAIIRLATNPNPLKGHYALIEAADLQPSHNALTFGKNPKYPEGVQERQYHTDREEQTKVIAHATHLKTDLVLMPSADMVNGPPAITPEGLVLDGNSRALSIQLAYAQGGRGLKYKTTLAKYAAQTGFTREQVLSMKQPVLVRVVPGLPMDVKTLHRVASAMNQSFTQGMTARTQAASMGMNVSPRTIEWLGNKLADSDISLREMLDKTGLAKEVLNRLIDDGVIPDNQANKYWDDKRQAMNVDGKTLIERMALGSIIPYPDLLSYAPAAILNKIERSLIPLAKIKGRGGEWDISKPLIAAFDLASRVQQAHNGNLDDYLRQISFTDKKDYSPQTVALTRAFLDWKPNQFTEALKKYAADAAADIPGQASLVEKVTPAESFSEWFGGSGKELIQLSRKQTPAAELARLRDEKFDQLSKEDQVKLLAEAQRQYDAVKLQKDDQGRILVPNGKPSNLNEHLARIVRTPWFKEWFGDWEALAEQKKEKDKGEKALELLLSQKSGEIAAMFRPGIGEIIFTYGKPGRLNTKGRLIEGKGIAHIIKQRNIESKDGLFVAKKMPEVIANGRVVKIQNEETPGERISLEYNGYIAILSLFYKGNQKVWLLTGWQKEDGGAGVNPATAYITASSGISRQSGASNKIISLNNHLVNPSSISKVIDENGEPKVVYHGTGIKFEYFNSSGNLSFFTSDPDYANAYAEVKGDASQLYPVFLAIKTPLVLNFDLANQYVTLPSLIEAFNKIDKNIGGKIKNTWKDWGKTYEFNPWEITETSDFKNIFKSAGYDGFIAKENNSPIYATINPTQIKSIYNQGTFNPADERISLSQGGQEQKQAGVSTDQARLVVNNLRQVYDRLGVDVQVMPLAEAPSSLKRAIDRAVARGDISLDDEFRGLYHDDPRTGQKTIFIFPDQLHTPGEAAEVFLHELIGHHSLHEIMEGKLDEFLNRLALAKRNEINAWAKEWNFDLTDRRSLLQAAEEWFAEAAQKGEVEATWWDRLVKTVKDWLRGLGIDLKLSDTEIKTTLSEAFAYAKTNNRFETGQQALKESLARMQADLTAGETLAWYRDLPAIARIYGPERLGNMIGRYLNGEQLQPGEAKAFAPIIDLARNQIMWSVPEEEGVRLSRKKKGVTPQELQKGDFVKYGKQVYRITGIVGGQIVFGEEWKNNQPYGRVGVRLDQDVLSNAYKVEPNINNEKSATKASPTPQEVHAHKTPSNMDYVSWYMQDKPPPGRYSVPLSATWKRYQQWAVDNGQASSIKEFQEGLIGLYKNGEASLTHHNRPSELSAEDKMLVFDHPRHGGTYPIFYWNPTQEKEIFYSRKRKDVSKENPLSLETAGLRIKHERSLSPTREGYWIVEGKGLKKYASMLEEIGARGNVFGMVLKGDENPTSKIIEALNAKTTVSAKNIETKKEAPIPESSYQEDVAEFKKAWDAYPDQEKRFRDIWWFRDKLGWPKEKFDNVVTRMREDGIVVANVGNPETFWEMGIPFEKFAYTDQGTHYLSLTWRGKNESLTSSGQKENISFSRGGRNRSTSTNIGLQIESAYQKIKNREGFSFIDISELQKESGIPLDRLHEYLREASRNGNAVLSVGDWSLSTPEVKSAAMKIKGDNRMYTLVKLISIAPYEENIQFARKRKTVEAGEVNQGLSFSRSPRPSAYSQPQGQGTPAQVEGRRSLGEVAGDIRKGFLAWKKNWNTGELNAFEKTFKTVEWLMEKPGAAGVIRPFLDREERKADLFTRCGGKEATEALVNLRKKDKAGYDLAGKIIDEMDVLAISWEKYKDRIEKNGFNGQAVSANVIDAVDKVRTSLDAWLDILLGQANEAIKRLDLQGKKDTTLYRNLLKIYHEMGQWRGSYAPRMREVGTHDVTYVDKEGGYHRDRMSNGLKAYQEQVRLRREGMTQVEVRKLEKLPESIYQDLSLPETAKLLEAAIENASLSEDEKDRITEELLTSIADTLRSRGYKERTLQRLSPGAYYAKATDANGNTSYYTRDNKDGIEALAKKLRNEGATNLIIGQTVKLTDAEKEKLFRDFVVRGYITDPLQRYGTYAMSMAGGIAKAEAAKAAGESFLGERRFYTRTADGWELVNKDTGEVIDQKPFTGDDETSGIKQKAFQLGGIDAKKYPQLHDYLKAYIKEQLRNPDKLDRIIGFLKSVASLKYLSSPKSAFINTTSMLTTAPPAIHQYALEGQGSLAHIGAAITKACADYTKIMLGKSPLKGHEQQFMDSIHGKLDQAQYTHDAMGQVYGAYGQAWSRVMNFALNLFSKTEQWNRGSTLLVAYRLAYDQQIKAGKTPEEAYSIAAARAKTATEKAHGIYGKATLPSAAWGGGLKGKLGTMFYVYQKFGHNYLQMVGDLVTKHNYKAAAFALVAPGLLGGAAGSTAYAVSMALAKAIMHGFGNDDDPEKLVMDQVRKYLGTTGEKTARYGLAGLMGVDISGSVGIELPRKLSDFLGPFGGLGEDVAQAKHFFETGQKWKAAEKVMPAAIANVFTAIRELNGATNTKGQRVWDENGRPYMPSTAETIGKMAGFRSAERATLQERQWENKELVARYKEKKDNITEEYRAYLADPNRKPNTLQGIMDDVTEFNDLVTRKKYQLLVPYITRETLVGQAKNMVRPGKREFAQIRE